MIRFLVSRKNSKWLSSLRKESTTTTTTIISTSWIDKSNLIPMKWKPFLHLARADKQVGTLLLLWPCFWGTSLATPIGSFPDILLMSKFAIGALVMRSAGCTIYDMWDKDFDKHV